MPRYATLCCVFIYDIIRIDRKKDRLIDIMIDSLYLVCVEFRLLSHHLTTYHEWVCMNECTELWIVRGENRYNVCGVRGQGGGGKSEQSAQAPRSSYVLQPPGVRRPYYCGDLV